MKTLKGLLLRLNFAAAVAGLIGWPVGLILLSLLLVLPSLPLSTETWPIWVLGAVLVGLPAWVCPRTGGRRGKVGHAPIALGHLLAMLETLRASATLPQRLLGGDWSGRAWLLLLMPLLLWFGFKVLERQFLLQRLPPELGVNVVLYEASEAWGFGPGGNETGVVLYALPNGVADAISEGDLGVLRQQDRWKQTPMRRGDDRDRYWFEGEGEAIDRAVSEPGNWYARARSGYILIMPRERRVAFVYAG